MIRHWLRCHQFALEDIQRLTNVVTIRYESFVEAPEQQLNRIYAELALPPAPLQVPIATDLNHKYFRYWHEYRRSWKRGVYARLVEQIFEGALNDFGYSFKDPYVTLDTPILGDETELGASEHPKTPPKPAAGA